MSSVPLSRMSPESGTPALPAMETADVREPVVFTPEAETTGVSCDPPLVVTGNPNVGKSVLFQLLTGRYATVSNYPGTTVMVSHGTASFEGRTCQVHDTPGINSLIASSEDEVVALDRILSGDPTVLQVGDAKNLARALVLALELAETGLPLVLNLNMLDEARERRIDIDTGKLSGLLGIPVAPTIATQRWGIGALRRAIPQARPSHATVHYPTVVEEAVEQMVGVLPGSRGRRALALLWLSGSRPVIDKLKERCDPLAIEAMERIAAQAQAQSASPLERLITQARLREAQRLTRQVVTMPAHEHRPGLQRLGALAMHPVWGLAVLAGVLAVMYVLIGDFAAQRAVGFIERTVFGHYITPACVWLVTHLIPWPWLQALFIGEYGLLTMALPYALAIILPIVGMFFLCFGFIEDVGYLPRLAVMANQACRVVGLNGKAVLPLVLGLGCDTMATMTTRILDSRRDRILVTLLLALGIPCSAQLGVIMAMLAGQPPLALAIWGIVVLLVIVIVGRTASRLVPGESSPFLYEVPPLRWPKLSNVFIKTLGRLEWYLKEAVPLFFLGTLVLFVLNTVGLLAILERFGRPLVVGWLGLPEQATTAFLIGFLRRDFGAAGLFALQRSGGLSGVQLVVSLITITLFVPCIAQYFMMIKERGWKWATGILVGVSGIALLVGGVVFHVLTWLRVTL